MNTSYGPLARYVKLRVAHAPGMPGAFSPLRLQRKPLVSDPGMHHGTCATRVAWCMSVSLTRGGGKNVPGIPSACTTRNFTYLARCPWCALCQLAVWSTSWVFHCHVICGWHSLENRHCFQEVQPYQITLHTNELPHKLLIQICQSVLFIGHLRQR